MSLPDIVSRIIVGIQAEQEGVICDLPGEPEYFRKEGRRAVLTVLLSFPQLAGKEKFH